MKILNYYTAQVQWYLYIIFRTTNVLGQRRKEKYIGKFVKEENEILQGSRRIGAQASAVH